jgi:hypothetical protein
MNKSLIRVATMLALVFLAGSSLGQEQQTDTETGIVGKFGIKGGVNFTNMYIDDVGDEKMKVGWHLGVFTKFPLTTGVSLQPELLYTSKGSEIIYTDPTLGTGEYRFNLNYFELPVLFTFNVAERFHINLGPYVGYLSKANVTDIEEDGTVEELVNLNEDSFKRWDFGAAGGIGFDVNNFTMGARYNLGFTEINNSTSLQQVAPNSKNSGLSIFLGFSF